MAESKPRILQGNRDMFWSVMVLMVIVGIFAGVTGQCSFSPSGPEQGPIREFDAQASLSDDARTLGFPIRSPEVPEGWTSNSGRVQPLGASTSSHVGWVTGERSYIELIQTDAPETRSGWSTVSHVPAGRWCRSLAESGPSTPVTTSVHCGCSTWETRGSP